MSEHSAPLSPLEVQSPPLPLVADAAAAAVAASLALPPLALPAPSPVLTAKAVGNLQIAYKYS